MFWRRVLTQKNTDLFAALHPGDVAIDCGANVGNVTAQLAREGVTVYAFEPNPHAFEALTKRFADQPNVHCINKGVWDHNATVKLYLHKNSPSDPIKWSAGSSLLTAKNNIEPDNYVMAEVVDLSQFISELSKPVAFLKIDVEGVECDILNKLIDSSQAATIGLIVVETHEKKIPSLKPSVAALTKKIATLSLRNIKLNWI